MQSFAAISNPFGDTLFRLRRARRLMQKVVAGKAGVDQSYLASLEKGRRDPPRQEVIERILEGLNATEAERTELKRAAALSRLIAVVEDFPAEFIGADALLRFAVAIPAMNASELEAIETIVDGFHRRFRQIPTEGAM
jgi:transcriptional regulator with XRE-family HTH domain